jgi:small subunit ribosomal protein S3
MIERSFITSNLMKHEIHDFILDFLKERSVARTEVKKTPLGEHVIIYCTKPGKVVGRKGNNITLLTKELKKRFNLENPQLEVAEIVDQDLDAVVVAQRIALSLERYGSKRFKSIMHKSAESVMRAGAKGVEIILSGKIPSSRAKSWRVFYGYLKKSGDLALTQVRAAKEFAVLKSGVVGIKVNIMPSNLTSPDDVSEIIKEESIVEDLDKVKNEDNTSSKDTNTNTNTEEAKEISSKNTTKTKAKKTSSFVKSDLSKKEESLEVPAGLDGSTDSNSATDSDNSADLDNFTGDEE